MSTKLFHRFDYQNSVTAQLLDAAKGEVIWGDRIDSDRGDIIAVQDFIAQRIVEGLRMKLSSEENVNLAGHANSRQLALYSVPRCIYSSLL